jgi:hypothetical protein
MCLFLLLFDLTKIILTNKIMKHNWTNDLYCEIKYLNLHLFLNFFQFSFSFCYLYLDFNFRKSSLFRKSLIYFL